MIMWYISHKAFFFPAWRNKIYTRNQSWRNLILKTTEMADIKFSEFWLHSMYYTLETIVFNFTVLLFIFLPFFLQEYISSKQANQVRSLMYMIDMLMTETLTKEDANENKHVKNYAMVHILLFLLIIKRTPVHING